MTTYSIFADTFYIWEAVSIHNLRICHAVVTGTHITWKNTFSIISERLGTRKLYFNY
jgi:hypothetical protein